MNLKLTKLFVKLLKETTEKIESGNCEIDEEEALNIMSILSHEPLNKEQACLYLNLSRSRFDDLIREGSLPRGRKKKGSKQLIWYKDELQQCLKPLTN